MGAACGRGSDKARKNADIALLEVMPQDVLMDNDEVKIMKIEGTKMVSGKQITSETDTFDGYKQKRSYFVIPQIDKLKKEKFELKRQMGISKPGQQQFSKFRVVNAGEEITTQKRLFYVNPL